MWAEGSTEAKALHWERGRKNERLKKSFLSQHMMKTTAQQNSEGSIELQWSEGPRL